MNRYPGRRERSCWTLKTRQLRLEIIQVLFDLGLLVVQVEVGAGPAGDDLGPEGPWGGVLAAQADLTVEDDVDLVRAADVDVVADQLLEEDPARDGPVQRHGGGELGLLDRQLPAVVGVLVRRDRKSTRLN